MRWGRALALLLLLAACGPTEEEPAAGEADPTTLAVGVMPLLDVAPLHLAVAEGFFAEEGLELDLVTVAGGAEAVPALVAGELDLTFGNPPTFIIAQQQGIDVRIVAEGSRAVPGLDGLFVSGDAAITTPDDLPGHTIAVNALGGVAELIVRTALTGHGVDPDAVTLTEVPFPEQEAALDAGRIDVAFVPQPFATFLRMGDARELINPHELEQLTGLPLVGYATSGAFADEHPEAVEAFRRALARGVEVAADDPSAVTEVLATYTELPDEVRERVVQPEWVWEPDVEALQDLVELMAEHGLLDEPLDVAPFVHP